MLRVFQFTFDMWSVEVVDETKSLFKIDVGEGTTWRPCATRFCRAIPDCPARARRGRCEKEAWASNGSDGPRDSVNHGNLLSSSYLLPTPQRHRAVEVFGLL